jgi:hypothetical protein
MLAAIVAALIVLLALGIYTIRNAPRTERATQPILKGAGERAEES